MAVNYIAIFICISATLIGFTTADTDCKVPFQPYSKQPGTCYAKLPKHKCDWIHGTYFKNNCFVTADHNSDYSSKFFCDFNKYFHHCTDSPGFCCMQSTKFECDKYAVVEYNETLGTCYAPVSGIHERTDEDVKCPEHFHYNNTQRQCEADVATEDKHQITEEDCKNVGGHINGTKCYVDPEPRPPPPEPCDDITAEGCDPGEIPTPPPKPTTDQTTPNPTTVSTTTIAPTLTTKNPNITVSTQGPTGTSYGTSSGYLTTTTNPTPTTSSPNATESTGSTSFTTSGSTSSGTVIPTTPTTSTTSNDPTSSIVTTPTSPPTDSTSPTTPYPPSSTTDSNNYTASTGATSSGTPYTQSETVTSTTAPTTTTSGTTPSPPSSSSPHPSSPNTSPAPSPTLPPPLPYFNISHTCPVGFMIAPTQCIGVWTPDCETKYNGTHYQEACFISFDEDGKQDEKRDPDDTDDTEDILPTTLTTQSTTLSTTPAPPTTTPDPYPNCVDFAANCQQHKRHCTNPIQMPLFISKCARTCGYCHCGYDPAKCGVTKAPPPTPPPGPTCIDSGSNCRELAHMCTDNHYATLMVQHCKNTCGFCQCTNTNANCNQWVRAGYCNIHERQGLMTQCRQACGWC